MHDIWLGLSIAWELALSRPWVAGGYVALLIVLHALALRHSRRAWRQSLLGAVLFGLLMAMVAMFALPLADGSSLADAIDLLDWLGLITLSLITGLAGTLLLWPLLALTRRGGGRLQGI